MKLTRKKCGGWNSVNSLNTVSFIMRKLLLLPLPFLLCACGANHDLDGSWTASGEVDESGDPEGPGVSWYKTYYFDGSSYTMDGYPPIEEKGNFDVIPVDTDHYSVYLTPEGEEGYESFIIKYGNDSIHFGGETYFKTD